MKITITKIPTGIHSQLRMDVENIQRGDEVDAALLFKITKIVQEYNDEQDKNA